MSIPSFGLKFRGLLLATKGMNEEEPSGPLESV